MDGIYDLGGVTGFGPVDVERDEPVFHEPWEALGYALGGLGLDVLRCFNMDEIRHAIERIEPRQYLASSYYDRIVTGVATLFVEKGIVTREELEARAGGRFLLARPIPPRARDVAPSPPVRFAVGDSVVVRDLHRAGHTRAPRYVRGKRGTVVRVAPAFSLPDVAAHGLERRAEPTYHVRFDARELWGDASEASAAVVVDLWQSYLEAR
jgi:nitrile hydratase